jgi:cation-transporting P-type ATPase I
MNLLGVRVPGPLETVGRLGKGLAGLALDSVQENRRRLVWTCPGRIYVEVHGVHGPNGERVARRVERALEGCPGVEWAQVNGPSSRVIIGVGERVPRRSELVKLIAKAESEPVSDEERVAEEELHHPADGVSRTRLPGVVAADAAGLVLAAINKIAPWAPLPAEVAGLVSVIDQHPRLRELAAGRLGGQERADTTTSMATAVVHGMAARGAGSALDLAERVLQWREARAHKQAWCGAEAELVSGPEDAKAEPVVVERPSPVPETAGDRHARRALMVGAAAGAAAIPFVGPRKAVALGLASLPKAQHVARAAFAAQLGRVLARRGALVMDRAALRGLDLIDVVVLDPTALGTGRWLLSDLVPLPGADPEELAARTFQLFNETDPQPVRRDGEWVLGPIDELELTGRKGTRERGRMSGTILGLAHKNRLEALVAVTEETAPGIEAITSAAQEAGLRVEVADEDRSLVGAVRELQADGCVVALLSGDRQALGASDLGIGVHRNGATPPWGAHLLVNEDLDTAALVVGAIGVSRQVSTDGTRIATAASAIGAVNALNAPPRLATGRSLRAVNTGALIALVDGAWRARRLRPNASVPTSSQPWHLMPAETVLDRLDTNPSGLTEQEAKRRIPAARHQQEERTSFTRAFLAELANPLTPVLAGGAAISASVGSPADAALVGSVIALSALIGTIQQVHTERALARLLERSAVMTTARRGKTERTITAEELVVGDIVLLESGDVVPADCRLLEGDGLEVDESSLTGESLPVAKDPAPVVAAEIAERRSMLYEGTTIAAGHAVAVVVAVGDATEVGRGMAAARRAAPTTGVEARLTELTRKTLPVAIGSAAAVAGAGLLRGIPIRESLGAAVNLAVASVPEGLPFLVHAAQLAAARRLAEHGAMVRNPRTIEALGRVDVLCFDKTGTLTEGKLSVGIVDDGDAAVSVAELGDSQRAVLAAAARATPGAEHPEDLPHQTDRAIAEGARAADVGPSAGANGWRKVDSLPFEPSRGYHATVGMSGERAILSVKGAPEIILPRLAGVDAKGRRRLEKRVEELAGSGHRVLAVAERELKSAELSEDTVSSLSLLGFVALADPVRESAPPAAAALLDAGVQTVMITGDHPATGEAVAGEVNGEGATKVITGGEIDDLDDDALEKVLPDVDVIARCSPAQKVRIIQAYQRLGRVVAMTGDGANDAPAIRLADVGIALGKRGTPAARAAADLVVTDDRLETIIAALVEGRAMWASVREALAVLLGGNLGEIAFTVLGSVITGRSPLTARQLLLVNLLTDLAPALAIALSQPAHESVPELLAEGPSTSLGKALTRDIGSRAGTTTLGATTAWTIARFTGRSRRASTIALAALVGTQLGQTLIAGGRDRTVLAAGLGSAAVLAGVIQTPGLSRFFGCTPLGPVGWTIALGSATAANLVGLAVNRGATSRPGR